MRKKGKLAPTTNSTSCVFLHKLRHLQFKLKIVSRSSFRVTHWTNSYLYNQRAASHLCCIESTDLWLRAFQPRTIKIHSTISLHSSILPQKQHFYVPSHVFIERRSEDYAGQFIMPKLLLLLFPAMFVYYELMFNLDRFTEISHLTSMLLSETCLCVLCFICHVLVICIIFYCTQDLRDFWSLSSFENQQRFKKSWPVNQAFVEPCQ